MGVIFKSLICFFAGVLLLQSVGGQTKKQIVNVADFEKKWIGQPFPIDLVKQTSINKHNIHPQYPTMIVFGFYNCMPCRRQMPAILAFADTVQNLNVVYLTFDDTELIHNELERADPQSEYKRKLGIYSLSQSLLNESQLVSFGYPIKYFVNTDNIIYNIDTYTDNSLSIQALQQKWYTLANSKY